MKRSSSQKASIHSLRAVPTERMAGQPTEYFPLFVDLRNRKCVVVGGGAIAARKISGLVQCGAHVTVVSPQVVPSICRLERDGEITLVHRGFLPADLNHAFMAIAATDSRRTNVAVFRACTARGVLCNAVDELEHCDFIYPAVVRRGPLQIAVSTGGASPALAARLRRDLEAMFGPEWEDWVMDVAAKRRALLAATMPKRQRTQLLRQTCSAAAYRAYLAATNCAVVNHRPTPRRIASSPANATPTR